jgi:uncharacterized protein YdhG (YjbR/CyaY superfamily)
MAERKTGRRAEKPDAEAEVLASIAEMADDDRVIAKRLFTLLKTVAPELSPKLWYKMPAWALAGEVVCFFQSGRKFKTRYSTLGFQQAARLDHGPMWPVAFALTELTAAEEAEIAALVKRAIG